MRDVADTGPDLRDAETANIPFLDGTGGRIASLCRVCVASHTALDTPSTASPQHRPKRDINNFRIPKLKPARRAMADDMNGAEACYLRASTCVVPDQIQPALRSLEAP